MYFRSPFFNGVAGGLYFDGELVFPIQFPGLRTFYDGLIKELCLVAADDAPTVVGGVVKIRKGSESYAAYLVDVSDPHASSVRIKTAGGVFAFRLKT
jgi:hypothetical protein